MTGMGSDPVDDSALALRLAAAFKYACLAELEALKPGNVHIFADGHGMTVQHFLRSADVAAPAICTPAARVGQRILLATQATMAEVGCNTNLGILLLAAPMLQAAQRAGGQFSMAQLQVVLQGLTVADAQAAYAAIRLANPAGLGQSGQHDVHQDVQVTLLVAMQEAAVRDRIAWQYAHAYADIVAALDYYRQCQQRWQRPAWAASAVYLRFLATLADSHVARKYGADLAEQLRAEALPHWQALEHSDNPKTLQGPLLAFDRALKLRQLNPGTSADLTVATLLLSRLTG